jgi:hypothetical protein
VNKRGGKPCVRGLRITVYEVLEYLASEQPNRAVLHFPFVWLPTMVVPIVFSAIWRVFGNFGKGKRLQNK